MDEKKRKANETEFDLWTENDKGGRIYYFEINGKLGWKAKYLKEVDKDEITKILAGDLRRKKYS